MIKGKYWRPAEILSGFEEFGTIALVPGIVVPRIRRKCLHYSVAFYSLLLCVHFCQIRIIAVAYVPFYYRRVVGNVA